MATRLRSGTVLYMCDSCCITTFASDPEAVYLVVGTALNVTLAPRSCTSGLLRVYKFNEEGTALEFLHSVLCYKRMTDGD